MKNYGHKDPIKIKLIDLVVLLSNTLKGSQRQDIGFEDADQSLHELLSNLNREVVVEKTDLESMLWSCGLLDEEKAFWHPRGYNFGNFVKLILGPSKTLDPTKFIVRER